MIEPEVELNARCRTSFPADVEPWRDLRCELDAGHGASGELHYARYDGGWARWSSPDVRVDESARAADAERRLLTTRWYAVPDDTVGGWAVASVDRPVSLHDHRRGDVALGDALSERVARHVAETHNRGLRQFGPDRG